MSSTRSTPASRGIIALYGLLVWGNVPNGLLVWGNVPIIVLAFGYVAYILFRNQMAASA